MEAVQKFKDLVGAGGQEKPEPAPAAPAAEKAAEQKILDEAAAAAGAPAEGAPAGEEPLDQAEIEQMLFDECLGAQNYTYEEFLELIDQPEEERGDTPDEKKHWSYPRRWKVVLWNLQIQNYMDDRLSAFVEFEFGGSREECKVRKGNSSRIYAKGEDKNYLRTPVASDMKSDEPVDLHFRKAFEYRGSYLDLEREKLKIKVWEYKNWSLNHLEAIFEEALLSFATGETHVERDLYKFVKGRRARRCRISFHLYFQELYDFEFSFLKWRLVQISSTNTLQNRVQGRTKTRSWQGTRSKSMAHGTRRLMDQAKYAMQQRQVKKEMHKRSTRELSSGHTMLSRRDGEAGSHRMRSRVDGTAASSKEVEGHGGGAESRERRADVVEKDGSQRNLSQHNLAVPDPTTRRNRSVLFHLDKEGASPKLPVPAAERETHVNREESDRGAIFGAHGLQSNSGQYNPTVIDNILLAHQNTILQSDQSADLPQAVLGHVPLPPAGPDGKSGSPALPTVRVTISLLHASAMNKGISIVSAELSNTLTPKWDNLGEIYFRGTLRDLDSTYLQITVEDMSAPRVVRQIGCGQLPLRGVVDYPFLRTELVAPTWLSLQAKVEGWSEDLERWCFGSVEGTVKIPHIPRYRQIGDVYEADSSRIYLVIRVKDVDQIITPDNRPAVDCYVEASFDGTSRRTRIVRNTLNPTWDDEITIPLRLPPSRDITVPHLTRKGKVWLDVWGVGQGYVDHLGGCSFSLYEIFFNEKHSRRGLVPKERIDLESHTRQAYETRVLVTSRRLSFIHKDDRPSTIQFEAWTCPDLLEVSGLEKMANVNYLVNEYDLRAARLCNKYWRVRRLRAKNILLDAVKHLYMRPAPTSQAPGSGEVLFDERDARGPSDKLRFFKGKKESVTSCVITLASFYRDELSALRGGCSSSEFKMWNEVIEAKNLLDSEAEIGPPRYFDVEYLDQRKETRYLPTTMDRIKPPIGVESESAVFHYIRCVPFAIKRENLVYTPDFTMQLKAGNALDHSILMASLLSGLPRYAFVCIGTLWDKQFHAWVASFHYDADKGSAIVKFWETTTGNVYTLKNRFFRPHVLMRLRDDPEVGVLKILNRQRRWRMGVLGYAVSDDSDDEGSHQLDGRAGPDVVPTGGPKLPYRTIDIMFNERNVWLNLQDPSPSRVWFDLWRLDLWYPFSPGLHDLRPCFITRGLGARLPAWQFERASQDIRDKVIQDITAFRASRNLPTKWNRDDILEAFLQTGLELLHQAATAREDDYRLARLKLEDWRKAFYSKVPSSYRVRGSPLHFNTMDSKTISDSIIKNVEFVECRDRTASFALGIVLYNLPGELVSTYVYTCLSQKVTERERRRIFAQKEEASREEALRKARKKQGMMGKAAATAEEPERKIDEEATAKTAEEVQQGEAGGASAEAAAGAVEKDVGAADEGAEDGVKKKKKKKVVKKGNVPKVKKRSFEDVEGSETAAIAVARDYYHGEQEPPDFKQLMTDIETAINGALEIPPGRVRAFQARYAEKKFVFGVRPPSADEGDTQPSAAALMEKLGPLLSELATQDGPFQTLTGGSATLEWGGAGTKIVDILQSEQADKGSDEGREREVEKTLLEDLNVDAMAATEDVDEKAISEAKLKKKKKKKKAETAALAERDELKVEDQEARAAAAHELASTQPPEEERGLSSHPGGIVEVAGEAIGAAAAAPGALAATTVEASVSIAKEKKKKGGEGTKKKAKKIPEETADLTTRIEEAQREEEPPSAPAAVDVSSSFGIRAAVMTVVAAVRFKRRRQKYSTHPSTSTEGDMQVEASPPAVVAPSSLSSSLSEDSDVLKLKRELEDMRARLRVAVELEASEVELSDESDLSETESLHSFVSSESLSSDEDELSDESSEASWAKMKENLLERHARLQNLVGTVKKSFQQLSDKEQASRVAMRAEYSRLNQEEATRWGPRNSGALLQPPPMERSFNTYTLLQAQPVAVRQYLDHYSAKHYTRVFQQPSARTRVPSEDMDPGDQQSRRKSSHEELYPAADGANLPPAPECYSCPLNHSVAPQSQEYYYLQVQSK